MSEKMFRFALLVLLSVLGCIAWGQSGRNPNIRKPAGVVYKLTGHNGGIRALAVSPNGRFCVSGGTDQKIILWDTHTGQRLWGTNSLPVEIKKHSITFSSDGDFVLVGGPKSILRLDAENGTVSSEIKTDVDGEVVTVAVDEASEKLLVHASFAKDLTVQLLHPVSGEKLGSIPQVGKSYEAVALSRDGSMVATTSPNDLTVRIWDTESKELLHQLQGLSSRPLCVAFSPDGKLIACGTAENPTCIWSTQTGKLDSQFPGGYVDNVAFSKNARRFAICGYSTGLQIIDAKRGRLAHFVRQPADDAFLSIGLLENGLLGLVGTKGSNQIYLLRYPN